MLIILNSMSLSEINLSVAYANDDLSDKNYLTYEKDGNLYNCVSKNGYYRCTDKRGSMLFTNVISKTSSWALKSGQKNQKIKNFQDVQKVKKSQNSQKNKKFQEIKKQAKSSSKSGKNFDLNSEDEEAFYQPMLVNLNNNSHTEVKKAVVDYENNIISNVKKIIKSKNLKSSDNQEFTVYHFGDSHVGGLHKYIKEEIESNFGTNKLKYFSCYRNGKTFNYFLNYNQVYFDIKQYNPDLIIITLGTNDAFGAKSNIINLEADIDLLIANIRSLAPDVPLLLTIPPDSFWRNGEINQNIKTVRNIIIKACLKNNESYWDLYNIMGGEYSMKRWFDLGLTQKDLVHFSPKGYMLHANLLYKAIINTYMY